MNISYKHFFMSVFILLLIPFVLAEEQRDNYNDAQYLDITFALSSDIAIASDGSSKNIDYIKTDLSFFPQTNNRQEVLSFKSHATPTARIQEKEEKISYTWSGNLGTTIDYGIDTQVHVKNLVTQIRKKIPFPPTAIEASVLKYAQATALIDITSEIEQQAQEILRTEDDYYTAVYKLAEWTRLNTNYNLTTLTAEVVQPSSWVLRHKQGVCDEITNLFISLARSVGIPARFVSGMVYTNVGYTWGAHGWAEVYFPDQGWVPFDVTFGEYGWLDPSHLKLKDDVDSGTPTAEYSWKATGIDLDIGELVLDTSIDTVGPQTPPTVKLDVIPHKTSVGFGSYVPLEVRVKNLQDTYLVPKITLLKAPTLLETNVQTVLLKPQEEKSIYWTMHIDDALDPQYVYTSTLEAQSMFGAKATNVIKYGAGDAYPHYSKTYAESLIVSHTQRQEKVLFTDIKVNCDGGKKTYYSDEAVTITCTLKNIKNAITHFDFCIADKCKTLSLSSQEETTVSESFDLSSSTRVPVIVESVQQVAYTYVPVDVIPLPEIIITEVSPTSVDYHEDVTLTFDLSANTDVHDLVVDFGFDRLTYNTLKETKTITLDTNGKTLTKGLLFTVTYKDKTGKSYEEKKAIPITVENIPWYARFIIWVRNLF